MSNPPIKDATTVILVRDADQSAPRVLMGQRGKTAAFMPNKYVFPGGAVDPSDALVTPRSINDVCAARLSNDVDGARACYDANAFLAAAIREVWEETGQIIGSAEARPASYPDNWQAFFERGYVPDARHLRFVFRAITPPGRPRRFDARFLMMDARHLASDPDDFSTAEDELSHLHWVGLDEARNLNLPFITEVVLAEIGALLKHSGPPESVPVFDNRGETSLFRRLV